LRSRRRELNHAETIIEGEIGVEPPAQAVVELLGAINIRNRNDNDLELHIEGPHVRRFDCSHHVISLMLVSLYHWRFKPTRART
jgi:hypothetical protein